MDILRIALLVAVVILFLNCATGGHVEGDGTATGGKVEVGDVEVSPSVHFPDPKPQNKE